MRIKIEIGYDMELKKVVIDVVLGSQSFKVIEGEVIEGHSDIFQLILLGDPQIKNMVDNAIAYAKDFQFQIAESL